MNDQMFRLYNWKGWIAAFTAGFVTVVVAGDAPFIAQGVLCQDRSPCRVIETLDAGQSDDGAGLAVLHVVLGEDHPLRI